MRIIVSGATGYVGKHLMKHLSTGDVQAIGIHRKTIESQIANHWSVLELERNISDYRPDVIVNLAASVNKSFTTTAVDEILEANINFSQKIASLGLTSGCKRFINISTYSMYNDLGDYRPETYYAASKKASEVLLEYFHQNTNMKVINLIFYDVYGPEQPHKRLLPTLVSAMKNRTEFHMSAGEQEMNFIFIDDVVTGILEAIKNPNLGEAEYMENYTLAGPEIFKLNEIPKIILEEFGYGTELVFFDLPYRPNQIMKFNPKYRILPSWSPKMRLRTGLKESFMNEKELT